ncbi:MAG: hypothetical protein JWO07_774 [Candidatus Saccharibacteria bacterium]|nr:hypothetical protein [Candidatus Saccharibacteria bacterium]
MSKNKKRRGLLAVELSKKTKLIIAIAAAIVIVLGITITVLMILANDTKPTSQATGTLNEDQKRQLAGQQAQQLSDIDKSAQDAIDRGDENRVNDIYQSALQNESDPTMKTNLIIDESRLYLYARNTNKAITIAKTAESLLSDKFLIADWLSQLYLTAKQYDQASQYFTLAGKWAGSPNNAGGPDKATYDQKAFDAANMAKASK